MTCLISSVPFYSGPQQCYEVGRISAAIPLLSCTGAVSDRIGVKCWCVNNLFLKELKKNHLASCSVYTKIHMHDDHPANTGSLPQ